eukprot:CAMPEP_0198658848 /NCGR_PEP_ID=MMETSP1467-20131203/28315_1 /TAXON_ID=1462469 /ORGANISM="unid. sp., Strain CCMP2135" /LENGTH=64 /DNA_ID=CAMNT_0044395143 /DNA_START=23 /DNA_END=217 /DNA_ORIENTATION=+
MARLETLNEGLALMVASFLNSKTTGWLRAASRTCKAVFVRNCPPLSTRDFLYFVLAGNADAYEA